MLEVCIDSFQSALNAIHGGADEIEVCSSLSEGGLTPSCGLVKEIQSALDNLQQKKTLHPICQEGCCCLQLIQRPKINIMLRCRSGWDFSYTQTEMDTMLSDLIIFKAMNIDRFVFGALDDNQNIHKDHCKEIIEKAHPIPVTFHRAFDVCVNPVLSLKKIIGLGFNRLLTSGQRDSADDSEAIILIKDLIMISEGKIDIMAGAGVDYKNAYLLVQAGCKIVHSSCKKMIILPNVNSNLSIGTKQTDLMSTDEGFVKKLKYSIKEVLEH